jgi:hypothetical protein
MMSNPFSHQIYELQLFEMEQRIARAEHERICAALVASQPGLPARARTLLGRLLIQIGTQLAPIGEAQPR